MRFWLEYAGVRLLDAALRLLSWQAASALGAAAGSASRWALRRRWKLTLANLEAAFPEKTPAERRRIAREAWRNAGRVFTELVKSRHLAREQFERIVRLEGQDVFDRALAEGKGVIVNAGHMGNWELAGVALAARGYPLAVVGRTMKNPLVSAWLWETRTRTGLTLFTHRNPFFQAVKWLKHGKPAAILIDHNIRQGGIFVPFFGRPAATSTLSGLLAVRLGSPIVTTRIRRDGARLILSFLGPLRPDAGADPDREAERLTVEMTRVLEGFVRERPEEWLWGHNRWRRWRQAHGAASAAEAAR